MSFSSLSPPGAVEAFPKRAAQAGIGVSDIGVLEAGRKLEVSIRREHGSKRGSFGYDHFSR